MGYSFLYHAVDDHTRLVYSEILGDERMETAAGFWERARQFFTEAGFEVTEVMTDNGSCYRSHVFAPALRADVKHRGTRPLRPRHLARLPQGGGRTIELLSQLTFVELGTRRQAVFHQHLTQAARRLLMQGGRWRLKGFCSHGKFCIQKYQGFTRILG